jgi:O-antigen/teichoic acid export membrane protein
MKVNLESIGAVIRRRLSGAGGILRALFWAAAGDGISRAMILVAFVLAARVLGSEEYGRFGIVRSTILVFTTLGGIGLGLTANRYLAEHVAKDLDLARRLIGSSYLLSAVAGATMALLLYASSSLVAGELLSSPSLERSFQLGSLAMLFSTVLGAQVGVLQGLHAYRLLAFGNLLLGLSGLVFVVGGAWLFRVNGAIFGLVLQQAIATAAFAFLVNREADRREIGGFIYSARGLGTILWRFSVPVALTTLAVAPFKWLGEALVAQRAGFGDLGVFHGAMAIAAVLITLPTTMNAPLISFAAENRHRINSANAATQHLTLYGSWYLFLLICAPFLFAPSFGSLVFGASFASPSFAETTVLLLIYSGLLVYYQGITRMMALGGNMWFSLLTNIVEGVALLVAIYALAGKGATGLALAFVISYVARVAVSLPFIIGQRVISLRTLPDRVFLASALGFLIIAVYQMLRIR